MKKISEEKIQELIRLYQSGIPPKILGEKFNIKNNSVTRILRKRGVERNHAAPKVTEEQTKYIIEQYQKGISSETIGRNLNINGTTVCRILKKNQIPIRPATKNKRKYKLSENIFDDMNTETMAYFYGLMIADGSVNKNQHSFNISLHKNDADILIRFSKLFYGIDKTKLDGNQKYLAVYNKDLTQKLIELGCPPNKTFVAEFPKWLELKNYKHFLRGYIDGDGCIDRKPKINITGNKYIINKINQILKSELDIEQTVYQSHGGKKKSFVIEITGQNKVHRLLGWIYNDANIYMKRKYQKSLELLKILDTKINIIKPLSYGTTYIPSYKNTVLIKDNVSQLNEKQKETIANFLFEFYRKYGFPYPTYPYQSLDKDLRDLIAFDVNSIKNNNTLSINKNAGVKIFKHFSPHYFTVKSKKLPSMIDAFYNDYLLMKTIKNRLGITFPKTFNISGNMLRQGLRNSYTAFAASIFKPTIAKYIFQTYAQQNSIVYDPSMGFGQRLLGAVSTNKNLTYIGVDTWNKVIQNINNMIDFLNDNKNIQINTPIIKHSCSSKFCPEEFKNKIDLAFTSPPYFDYELYSDDETQAYQNGYDAFIVWWKNTCQNVYTLLKHKGLFILNLPNSELLADMMKTLTNLSFIEINRYTLPMSRNTSFRASKWEYIIVLQKS